MKSNENFSILSSIREIIYRRRRGSPFYIARRCLICSHKSIQYLMWIFLVACIRQRTRTEHGVGFKCLFECLQMKIHEMRRAEGFIIKTCEISHKSLGRRRRWKLCPPDWTQSSNWSTIEIVLRLCKLLSFPNSLQKNFSSHLRRSLRKLD